MMMYLSAVPKACHGTDRCRRLTCHKPREVAFLRKSVDARVKDRRKILVSGRNSVFDTVEMFQGRGQLVDFATIEMKVVVTLLVIRAQENSLSVQRPNRFEFDRLAHQSSKDVAFTGDDAFMHFEDMVAAPDL